MNCPRCSEPLDERTREGVEIDVCRRCRGVWLDRGELEKLIARTTADIDEAERGRAAWDDDRRRYTDEDRRRHLGDHDHHRGPYRRKKSWLESLGDLFD